MSAYLIPADHGLVLFDPATYPSFLSTDWTPPQLLGHLAEQTRQRRLLLWGTGAPGQWRIALSMKWSNEKGYREVAGPIVASTDRLFFTDYRTLSKAADLPGNALIEEVNDDDAVLLRPGNYHCRVVQLFDPKVTRSDGAARLPGTHFLIELERSDAPLDPWPTLPWFDEG